MGLGNKLIVSASGFPGTNKTWRFVQDAFREPLGALAQLAGDKTIITGVVVNNADPNNVTVSNGYISYNGEIIPFVGGTFVGTVTIVENVENVMYNTDADNNLQLDSLPAYRTIFAKCGTGGSDIFQFSDLATLKTVKELSDFELPSDIVRDANYVHTDYNFTLALLQKLNEIEAGAQVNVNADWNNTTPSSKKFIENKPFNELKFTYGRLQTSNVNNGQNMSNYSYNRAFVYPPSGFNLSHLVGFIPSISEVYFGGNVDGNDTLWCNYQTDYTNNRVIVICNNSESRSAAKVHYIAIWKK